MTPRSTARAAFVLREGEGARRGAAGSFDGSVRPRTARADSAGGKEGESERGAARAGEARAVTCPSRPTPFARRCAGSATRDGGPVPRWLRAVFARESAPCARNRQTSGGADGRLGDAMTLAVAARHHSPRRPLLRARQIPPPTYSAASDRVSSVRRSASWGTRSLRYCADTYALSTSSSSGSVT